MSSLRITAAILAVTVLAACNRDDDKFSAAGVFETTEVIVSSEANGKIMVKLSVRLTAPSCSLNSSKFLPTWRL